MNAGIVRELLLRESFGFAQATKISTEAMTYIHTPISVEMSTNGLQTMSNIGLDFARHNGRKSCH